MTDKKFTDEEIIKALECCANGKCGECPLFKEDCGDDIICKNALDLITHLQEENERLQKEVNLVSIQFQDLQEETDEIKSKAYKEFAEKLKKKCYEDFEESDEMLAPYVTEDNIDEVLKEMVSDDNDK